MKILAFKTATTGLVQYKDENGVSIRSADPRQPHIVRLAAVLYDTSTREIEQTLDFIVKPDGWEIEPGAIEIHGITEAVAMANGVDEKTALELFIGMWKGCDLRVAHNAPFDNRIIRIALKRYLPDAIPDEVWKDKNLYFCTSANSKGSGALSKKLADVHLHYVGNVLSGAGDSMSEANAALSIYRKMNNI